ncbi:MAG: HlyD family efflux transporter periplasmic adaptor subunit [Phycisphaerae bacterium]
MKKLFITLVVLGGLWLGYDRLRKIDLDLGMLRGESVKCQRGDLTIPINATGEVGPLSRHEIKSEASGEIIEIRYQPGAMVKKGDLLIRLKKDDEQRSVDRAKADVTRTKAMLESAKIKERRLKTVRLEQARLRIEQIQARLDFAEFNLNKIERLHVEDQSSPDELKRVRANYKERSAGLELAKADLEDAKIAVELAYQDVLLAQAAFEQVVTALADAEERLADTDIVSPIDGMVVEIKRQIGEVIQGGKTTFTGGTVLGVVADVSKLYVRAEVDEADIGAVRDLSPQWARPGQTRAAEDEIPFKSVTPVKVRVESFRDEEFVGTIERIHPEPNSRVSSVVTYQVDILLTSENRSKLLSGMQADVEFTAQSVHEVVLVPHEAIRRDEFDRLGVYVPDVDEKTGQRDKRFVPCRFGLDNGMYAEVLEGLSEGDEVYTVLPHKVQRDRDKD